MFIKIIIDSRDMIEINERYLENDTTIINDVDSVNRNDNNEEYFRDRVSNDSRVTTDSNFSSNQD